MPTTIQLPQVGESVTEGVIVRWLKRPGDRVARYEPLVEVETDKVTMEVPSPVGGTLLRTLAGEGDTVPMGSPICEVDVQEEQAPARPPSGTVGVLVEPGPGFGATGAQPEGREAPQPLRSPLRLTPVVQALAAQHGVPLEELARIRGSGLEGRVTKQDILRHIQQRDASPSAATPEDVASTAAPPPEAPAAPAAPSLAPGPDEEWLPLTPIRRRIAQNVALTAREVPAAWTTFEVDITELVRWRQAVKEEFQHTEGVELTYLPFVLKALTESLREHPKLNATWGGTHIVLKKRTNVGITVAAPQGLMVPVVRDADKYSVAGLARALHDLVARAREGRLSLTEVQGATFTLNNAGALGSMVSHALINYPQAAILTMEAISKRVVVVGDAIGIRDRMNLTVTFDHRVMDGHEAGAFLASVKRRLEAMGPEGSLY